MAKIQSIKDLYVLALAEGEGVGTAYEYYAKRLVLQPWIKGLERPQRMLVAGLPEKYGSSLDFLLLCAEMGCQVTVVDERQSALARLTTALEQLRKDHYLPELQPDSYLTNNLSELPELIGRFDLVVSSEVLQRLDADRRTAYYNRLQELAPHAALFAPNDNNDAHVGLSGLSGLTLSEMEALIGRSPLGGGSAASSRAGYIDMPPFPPGITRTDSQREEAATGTAEAVAMWGLGIYAHLERYVPLNIRRKQSHIVFGLT